MSTDPADGRDDVADAPGPGTGTSGDDPGTGPIPLDLVSGLFLLAVAAVFIVQAGEGALDWLFPRTLSYGLGLLALYFTIRGLLGAGQRTSTLVPVLQGRGIDVFVFCVITASYVALTRAVGFWIMTVAMLFAGAVYLDERRTPARIALAAGVALAVCIVAYVVLRRIFYVPLPPARWLPF